MRAKLYGLRGLDLSYLYDHPFLDLKHVLVLINDGRFKEYTAVLEGKTGQEGKDVPRLYNDGRYEEIIGYVER